MVHLALNGREEFLEMISEQLECPTCANRSETDSNENDEHDEDETEEEEQDEDETEEEEQDED